MDAVEISKIFPELGTPEEIEASFKRLGALPTISLKYETEYFFAPLTFGKDQDLQRDVLYILVYEVSGGDTKPVGRISMSRNHWDYLVKTGNSTLNFRRMFQ